MDEAIKKIERALEERRPRSKIDALLPVRFQQGKPAEEGIGITHYGKTSGGAAPPEIEAKAAKDYQSVQFNAPPAPADMAAQIGTGGREFKLDELSAGGAPSQPADAQLGTGEREFNLDELSPTQPSASDPLMGDMLKPSVREFTLDDLSSGEGGGKA